MRITSLRRLSLYAFVFISALVVQFCWMKFLSPAGLAPDFILILVIFIGLMRGSFIGEVMGFAWGISWDVLSVGLFGSHALMFVLVGYLAGLLNRKWNESKIVTQMLLAGLASIFFSLGLFALYQVFAPAGFSFKFNYISALQPLYNMLVAPVVFKAGSIVAEMLTSGTEEEYF